MMNQGYLDAIYSTSTVAAGVNFPARTVVLVQSDRFDGRTFSDLTATELHQMTGRAGRRGKDQIGFALVLPGLYQDPLLIHLLIDSPPEPIKSQIQMSFSMVLNLLLSHRPSEIKGLLQRSLAAFQEREAHPGIRKESARLLNKLKKILPEGVIPDEDPIEFLHAVQVGAGLKKRVQTLKRDVSEEQRGLLFSQYLKRGQLFVHKGAQVYVLFHTFYRNRKRYCSAHRVTRPVKVRRRQIRLRKIPVQTIDHILDYRVDIPEGLSAETLGSLLSSIPIEQVKPIRLDPTTHSYQYEELRKAEKELDRLPDFRRTLDEVKLDKNGKAHVKKLEALAVGIDQVRDYLWKEFNRHLYFLRDTGFVDRENRLTEDGRWASSLRLDHPLLIAEAIRRDIFDRADPPTLAALIAPFVVDKIREIEVSDDGRRDMEALRRGFKKMIRAIDPLRRIKRAMGFETPQLQFWPAACLYLWATNMAWDDLIRQTAIEEGDMAMLVSRTTDHLRQLLDLENTHPNLARTARKAIPIILREPVGLPLSGIPPAVDQS
jgi:superfamily II RNA helicase